MHDRVSGPPPVQATRVARGCALPRIAGAIRRALRWFPALESLHLGNSQSSRVRPVTLPKTNPSTPRCFLLIALTLFCLAALHAYAGSDEAINVVVRMQGDEAIVDVNFHVR